VHPALNGRDREPSPAEAGQRNGDISLAAPEIALHNHDGIDDHCPCCCHGQVKREQAMKAQGGEVDRTPRTSESVGSNNRILVFRRRFLAPESKRFESSARSQFSPVSFRWHSRSISPPRPASHPRT
jgi:hypothetical protein